MDVFGAEDRRWKVGTVVAVTGAPAEAVAVALRGAKVDDKPLSVPRATVQRFLARAGTHTAAASATGSKGAGTVCRLTEAQTAEWGAKLGAAAAAIAAPANAPPGGVEAALDLVKSPALLEMALEVLLSDVAYKFTGDGAPQWRALTDGVLVPLAALIAAATAPGLPPLPPSALEVARRLFLSPPAYFWSCQLVEHVAPETEGMRYANGKWAAVPPSCPWCMRPA